MRELHLEAMQINGAADNKLRRAKGLVVQRWRRANGWTQETLADKAQIPERNKISYIETGKYELSEEYLVRMLAAFGKTHPDFANAVAETMTEIDLLEGPAGIALDRLEEPFAVVREMPDTPANGTREEHKPMATTIAHVLFLDIVGYSKRTTAEQGRLARALSDAVKATE